MPFSQGFTLPEGPHFKFNGLLDLPEINVLLASQPLSHAYRGMKKTE
jgi:hypothetical protein